MTEKSPDADREKSKSPLSAILLWTIGVLLPPVFSVVDRMQYESSGEYLADPILYGMWGLAGGLVLIGALKMRTIKRKLIWLGLSVVAIILTVIVQVVLTFLMQ